MVTRWYSYCIIIRSTAREQGIGDVPTAADLLIFIRLQWFERCEFASQMSCVFLEAFFFFLKLFWRFGLDINLLRTSKTKCLKQEKRRGRGMGMVAQMVRG